MPRSRKRQPEVPPGYQLVELTADDVTALVLVALAVDNPDGLRGTTIMTANGVTDCGALIARLRSEVELADGSACITVLVRGDA